MWLEVIRREYKAAQHAKRCASPLGHVSSWDAADEVEKICRWMLSVFHILYEFNNIFYIMYTSMVITNTV